MVVLDDLVSAGHEGLVDAALRYEPDMGVPFGHFAHRRIRGAMIDALRRGDPASRAHRRAARNLEVAQAVLDAAAEQPLDRRASLEERVAAVRALVEKTAVAVALASSTSHQDDTTSPDTLPDSETTSLDEAVDRTLLRRRLQTAVEALPPDERALIEAVYFDDEPMAHYAERTGVHKSTICRRHARAISRLSSHLKTKKRATPTGASHPDEAPAAAGADAPDETGDVDLTPG